MKLTLDSPILEKLLDHAASAARLVGYLDDDGRADLISQLR